MLLCPLPKITSCLIQAALTVCLGNCIACIYVRATVVLDQLAASSPPLDPSFQTLITFRWWWVWVYNGTGKQRVRQGLERRDRRRRKGWNKERSRKRDFRQEIQARTLMSWDPVFLCMCNHARKYVCQKHGYLTEGQYYPKQLHSAGPKHKPEKRKHLCLHPPDSPRPLVVPPAPWSLPFCSAETYSGGHSQLCLHTFPPLTFLIRSGRNFCKTLPLVTDISGNQIH